MTNSLNTNMDFQPQKMKVVRNRLFYLMPPWNMYIFWDAKTGFSCFCLEPKDVFDFTDFDTTICVGDTVLYTIPSADYAEGYLWTYSGTGAQFRLANSNDAFQPFNASHIASIEANGLEVFFPSGAT